MRYGSNIDYEKTYDSTYFGHSNSTTSFSSNLVGALVGYCRTNSIKSVLDISGGNGELSKRLNERNLNSIYTDYVYRPGCIEFDLTSSDADTVGHIKSSALSALGQQNYLATCLDVLEHLDIEHIPPALRNIFELTDDYIIASISTRTSSDDNRFNCSILPLTMWTKIFELTGFELISNDIFPSCTMHHTATPDANQGHYAIQHWRKLNIFKDKNLGEPIYMLFRKNKKPTYDAREELAKLLDINYIYEKRRRAQWSPDLPLCIAINSAQDVLFFTPLLQAVENKSLYIALRMHVLDKCYEMFLITMWRRCGIVVYPYERAEDLNLSWMRGGNWLSATESTMWITHQLGFHATTHAKLAGMKTVLFQHGIWNESTDGRAIYFASDHIASWGDREKLDFENNITTVARNVYPRGSYSNKTIHPIGSHKFSDSKFPINKDYIYRRLDIDQRLYSKIVLIGTNLHWNVHGFSPMQVVQSIIRFINNNPDIYFIIKLHMAEGDLYEWVPQPDNSIIIDDFAMNCLGLTMSRLVKGVDLVMSTLSTLLLDAAVAGTKFMQIDTNASASYQFVTPVDIKNANTSDVFNGSSDSVKSFVDYYAPAAEEKFYEYLVSLLSTQQIQSRNASDIDDLLKNFAMGSEMEKQWLRTAPPI